MKNVARVKSMEKICSRYLVKHEGMWFRNKVRVLVLQHADWYGWGTRQQKMQTEKGNPFLSVTQ